MNVLLTGSTGYIGKRLLKVLTDRSDEISCFVRNLDRMTTPENAGYPVQGFEVDLLKPIPEKLSAIDLDVAFYLVHSMSSSINSFMKEEADSARNFADFISKTNCKQIIYLSGISNSKKLSKHLQSRRNVEDILRTSGVAVTVLRAGIIVGSGSASFEIIRDLMEKMPVMLVPRWVMTRCQPVAIADVLKYITGCMLNKETFGQTFDIGGTEILTYREMLLQYAALRGFKRYIRVVPFISPRLSSYWLYFVTSTSYKLAVNLVNSMSVEVVCKDNRLQEMLGIQPLSYKEACEAALRRINLNTVQSSWTDAVSISKRKGSLFDHMEVPGYGVLGFKRTMKVKADTDLIADRFFCIGGETGWYFMDWVWEIRGGIDRMAGGVGLRRGRRSATEIFPGDALDFWRVLVADRPKKRLLLFAEMKLPGEAWLEFRIEKQEDVNYFHLIATFMPHGLSGRLYWYLLLPIHIFIFKGMSNRITQP
ncbi:MAG: SDR family oxidoreductase [Bacteroidetes bacterium]|nr:SDR family oxidoreductase [Bacteroidota bacterium]